MYIAAYTAAGTLVATYRPEAGEDLDELLAADQLRYVETVAPDEAPRGFDHVIIVEEDSP